MPDAPASKFSRLHQSAIMVLEKWLEDHMDFPYPNESEKKILANETCIPFKKVTAIIGKVNFIYSRFQLNEF